MLKGFEEYTVDLTDQEKREILPVIVALLKGLTPGKGSAMTNTDIAKYLASRGIRAAGPKIRKFISYIEINGLIPRLIASSAGYHIAENVQELSDYIESLQGRYLIIGARIKTKAKFLESVLERNAERERQNGSK